MVSTQDSIALSEVWHAMPHDMPVNTALCITSFYCLTPRKQNVAHSNASVVAGKVPILFDVICGLVNNWPQNLLV